MVTIIDYGIGNLRSIEKAFQAVGAPVERTDDPERIANAERVVLPGVGAFGACAQEIRRRGLEATIRGFVDTGRPFLGVCVGMQLLFEYSTERGRYQGLGLLPGRVVHVAEAYAAQPAPAGGVPADAEADTADAFPLKVPHMGWNTVDLATASPLLGGLPEAPYFYFVHSYCAQPEVASDVLGTTHYGLDVPAIVGRNNVFGVQFHPEKSQQNGLRILKNFATVSLPS